MDWTDQRDALLGAVPAVPDALRDLRSPSIYAWWDLDGAPTQFWPTGFPDVVTSRPLYVGIARTTLAVRGGGMHLKTTRISTLRRSLVALLVDELELRDQIVPGPGQKFGLTAEGDSLLNFWMGNNLHVTWHDTPEPGAHERLIVGDLMPPLNDVFAHDGPYWKAMRARHKELRARFD
ncbi:GIY-YIG nuclease family protein [Rathayibacter sp. AY1D9]|uniref:GIY-YIG nuclease family protein n=1 Tax=Rathayibacter sp. AY1D9 TaxID=2080548 RepID=UPI000CE77C64|nr:hypothetical protein [Rathayibacter sp. AY1D9]PPH83921.1 hypothetical protein C5C50_04270 [Rathayibacter sp. AY1D9]